MGAYRTGVIVFTGHNPVEKLLDDIGVFTSNVIKILVDRKPFDVRCLLLAE
jgi:hypothetical protein